MKDILTPEISAIAVFLQGLFSFFSPCVLPLLPVYFGYLSGGTAERNADGSLRFDRGRVMINTLFFVLGVFPFGPGCLRSGQCFNKTTETDYAHWRGPYDPVWAIPVRPAGGVGLFG